MGDHVAAISVIRFTVFTQIALVVWMSDIGKGKLSQEVSEGGVDGPEDAIEMDAFIAVFDGIVGGFGEPKAAHCEFDLR